MSKADTKPKKQRPALSPEADENIMTSLAMDLARKKLEDGTASSQLIHLFAKRASKKEQIELEILEAQKKLILAKTEALKDAKDSKELFDKAISAFKAYSGD